MDILGLIGGFLTSFAFFPQVMKAVKSKHTKDLSLPMLLMADTGVVLWLIYGLAIENVPLIAANLLSFIFLTATLWMKKKYG